MKRRTGRALRVDVHKHIAKARPYLALLLTAG
jgi:hypothetical protein